ncbi:hypothetical protein [Streptomyces sp. NPDC055709]
MDQQARSSPQRANRDANGRRAAEYAAVIAGVGIDTDEAMRSVQAALTNRIAAPPTSRPPDGDPP